MKKWLLFCAAAGITLYFIIMYETPEAYRFLAAEAVWFAAALFQLCWMKHKVQIDLVNYVRVVNKGKEIPVQLSMKNTGILPVPFMEVFLKVDGQWHKQSYSCFLKGHAKREKILHIKADYAGFCRIDIGKVVYYDFLHLFSGKQTLRKGISVLVLPKLYPVAMEIQSAFRYYGEDSGLYYEDEEGNDPSEILEIREYQAGDRLQKIHWKLSQRTDTLMVKEYSEPVGFAVVFLLDTESFFEAYLETFMSISMEMCHEKCIHYICFMNSHGALIRKPVVKEENLYLFLQSLMDMDKGRREIRASGVGEQRKHLDADVYDDWYGQGSYHTSIRLTEKLELYKQEELVGRIDAKHIEKGLAELMLEL